MDVWQWVVLYAAFLGVVQLLIYYYLRRGRERQSVAVSGAGDRTNGAVPNSSGLREAPGSPDDVEGRPEADPQAVGDEETLVCPHCGARNEREPTFTYCRSCVSQLGA